MSESKRKGQGLVEFALILPILILLLLGIAEGAHIIQAYIGAQSAARAAARYAVSGQPLNAVGDPWTKTPEERLPFIKTVAISESLGVGYTRVVTQLADYNACLNSPNLNCAGTLGVKVDAVQYSSSGNLNNSATVEDYPGTEGNDVRVTLYHNVVIWDPIYEAIVRGVSGAPYFAIKAEVVMRNEGGPPITGNVPPPEEDSGTNPNTGGNGTNSNPVIEIVEGDVQPVGEIVHIRVRFHNANTPYNIYVGGTLLPNSPVTTDAQGNGILTYQIPYDQAPGTYLVECRTFAGATVADTQLILTASIKPIILTNGDTWPLGSVLTYSLASHPASNNFVILMSRGAANVSLSAAHSTTVEGNSVSQGQYVITGSTIVPGEWLLQSRIASTVYASRTILLTQGCIMLNQAACGQSIFIPAGVHLNILLTKHAYNRDYKVMLVTNNITETVINPTVTTDDQGTEFLSYYLPLNMANGNYAIRTYDLNPLSQKIAETPFVVNTPTNAFIPVLGGYKWPAGSKILFQLRNHTPGTRYDIFWEGARIITNTAATNIDGMLELSYKIPITMSQGFTYTLQSRPHGSAVATYTAQSADIEIIPQPYLSIAEGSPQVPGATVTVELYNHNLNTRYRVYVDEPSIASPGRELAGSPVTTDNTGYKTIKYTIPPNEPTGGVITITSYLRNEAPLTVTAQTTLSLLAADLQVLSIQTPPNPVFNQEMPVTVTVINVSPVTITQQSFDVDVYLDPADTPNLNRSLPPGDIKVWIQPPLAYSQTRTFTTMIPIYGAYDHNIWARVDTSNRIPEGSANCLAEPTSFECNNLRSVTVSPYSCAYEFNAGVLTSTNMIGFGSTAPLPTTYQPLTVNADTGLIALTNTGGIATDQNNDNDSGSGYLFAYQQISGNFDVRVRALGQSPTSATSNSFFGLEVRDSLASTSGKLMLGISGAQTLRYWHRVGGTGTNVTPPGVTWTGFGAGPVWLRITRTGNNFTLYYSTSTNDPPPSNSWVQITNPPLTLSGLNDPVYLGLNNTPNSTTRNTVTFNGYHVCAAPAGAENCGEVRESAGLVVLDTTNTMNTPTAWTPASRSNKIGYWINNTYSPDSYTSPSGSPELRYGVNITQDNVGKPFYVWILGYSASGSDNSLFIGPTASPPSTSTYMSQGSSGLLGWFNTLNGGQPATVSFSAVGSNSLSVWMREDGFEIYQILLTTDPNFTPSIDTNFKSSQCSMAGIPRIPPGTKSCESVVTNGDFENDDQMNLWIYQGIAQQVTRTSLPHYFGIGQSFSMMLPATNIGGSPRRPWLYQEVQMPGWVITPTLNSDNGTSLNLKLHVAVNPENREDPDPFQVVLKNVAGADISQPITITTGADAPFIDPQNPDPENSQWVYKTLALDDAFSPPETLLNYSDQTVRLYFYSPNPSGTYSTRFYVDNVALDVCTMQPIPTQFSTKVAGKVYVWRNNKFEETPGVFVWIYAVNGQMDKTYTIQDSTFSFYNLPAATGGTTYIVYAEYWEDNVPHIASTVISLSPGQRMEDLMLLLF